MSCRLVCNFAQVVYFSTVEIINACYCGVYSSILLEKSDSQLVTGSWMVEHQQEGYCRDWIRIFSCNRFTHYWRQSKQSQTIWFLRPLPMIFWSQRWCPLHCISQCLLPGNEEDIRHQILRRCMRHSYTRLKRSTFLVRLKTFSRERSLHFRVKVYVNITIAILHLGKIRIKVESKEYLKRSSQDDLIDVLIEH